MAVAAALLCAAASRAMGIPPPPAALALAFAGTLVVYNVDRLRDLERDRQTAPLRSAFVDRHRSVLMAIIAAGAVVAVAAAACAGLRVVAWSTALLALGLAHRRIKTVPFGKGFYIAAAWTAVVVGIPRLLDPRAAHAVPAASVLYLTLLANAVASSARDAEALPARLGLSRSLRLATVCTAIGFFLAVAAGPPVSRLGWVPLCTVSALLLFQPGERFGLLVLDGALLAGGALALLAS